MDTLLAVLLALIPIVGVFLALALISDLAERFIEGE